MNYVILKRPWPTRKRWMWLLMLAELLCLIPLLILHGIAQPNTWRTTLWQVGYDHGWNSDPRMILYAYANYRPLPEIPMVWSQFITDFNVIITIVSLFALLLKMVGFIMHVLFPLFALLLHLGLVAIWTVSVYGQIGRDYADPLYPSPVAWYIYRSCDAAGGRYHAVRSCHLARASFAVSVLMLFVLVVNLGHAIRGMWPTENDRLPPGQRRSRSRKGGEGSEDDDDDDTSNSDASPSDAKHGQERWEMSNFASGGAGPGGARGPASPGFPPRSPGFPAPPFTPRTTAFLQLDRKLPLRQHYG
ncbi:hypothetical protein SODALDRAFT_131894 [Sodiomyces alkalinus F11]|uniref:Uncharacterized protein n=1 Tax=Sodiomyces alkalinus (strain CBS 110278 / VKM F-3762 / F11) TaxID=1314773 RepID=A0A3N2PYM4_SODAK|nr:hypothetical protein SODALDRAFT_131894 [Sodiomyces alkalinus F11]ROT39528.1 hypothetical protein SODALDRAFT_131894 [Sodiomyces alkalinus F11]